MNSLLASMKKQCTKHTYYAFRHLKDEKIDIEDRIEEYNSKRTKMMWLIKDEMVSDQSEEVLEFDNTFEDVLPELNLTKSEDNDTTQDVCRYHSKGFCKQGSSCKFYHSHIDCKDHILEGKCLNSSCKNRHRVECRYFKTNSCKRSPCTFLHREHSEKHDESEVVKSLNELKTVVKIKDAEIGFKVK